MHQQDSQPDAGPQPGGTWEAIEPYQPQPGSWRGRAQITDGHTTQSELCDHPWLSKDHPGHDDKSAAWACGQDLAENLRSEHVDLGTPQAAKARAFLDGKWGADMVTDEMARSVVHGLDGTAAPACAEDHSYLVVDPGDPPLYEGSDFGRAWETALAGFTSDGDGRFHAHVTACHRDTRTCPQEESRVRRAALDYWLAGQPGAASGNPAGPQAGEPGRHLPR